MVSPDRLELIAHALNIFNNAMVRAGQGVLTDDEVDAAWDNVNGRFKESVERWEKRRRDKAAGKAFTPKGEVENPGSDVS